MHRFRTFSGVCLLVLAALDGAVHAQATPPVVTYGPSRQSAKWIDTGSGKVAVDQGATWQGVTVYLSLTWDLVAVDAATGKKLWSRDVGAFWNELTFREVEVEGKKSWAVELRPGAGQRAPERRQYHDLATGEQVLRESDEPAGKVVAIESQWAGAHSNLDKPLRRTVGSEAAFRDEVLTPMFAQMESPPKFGAIDFAKSIVLVISSGDSWNSDGFTARAWDQVDTLLVRLEARTYQTAGPDGGGRRVRPYGIFVLPRAEPFRKVVVERNTQNLIGGPAIWSELCRFEKLGAPAAPAPAPAAPKKQQAGRRAADLPADARQPRTPSRCSTSSWSSRSYPRPRLATVSASIAAAFSFCARSLL
jgi:hypothetical protein